MGQKKLQRSKTSEYNEEEMKESERVGIRETPNTIQRRLSVSRDVALFREFPSGLLSPPPLPNPTLHSFMFQIILFVVCCFSACYTASIAR